MLILAKYVKNESKLNTEIIDSLDLSVGLKEQLSSNDLTIAQLMSIKTSDLAEKLGIDHDVARLIINAVR
jgi:hypothetical protein